MVEFLGRSQRFIQRWLHPLEPTSTLIPPGAQNKVKPERHKQHHGHHLADETCYHDMHALVRPLLVLGRGSHASSDRLEHQGEGIAANEYVGIHIGLQPGVLFADCDNDPAKAKIDSCCEECGRDGERNEIAVTCQDTLTCYARGDLHQEIVHQEGVLVQHHTADIAYRLAEKSDAHCGRVLPRLAANAEPSLSHQEKDEAHHVDDISSDIGSIFDRLPCFGAYADFAVFP